MRRLLDKRSIYVTGKGGVGKSTAAAAIAMLNAAAGRRVLLFEIHAKSRMGAIFGGPPLEHRPRRLAENIWGCNINPQQSMHEYALLVLHYEMLYKAVFGNKLVEYFLDSIPSLGELCMTGKIWYHHQVREVYEGVPPPDVLVLDCPASGHALTLLQAPRVIGELTPPGPMKDKATEMWGYFSDAAAAATVLVSLPEEMPANEAIEFYQQAHAGGLPPGYLIINRCLPHADALRMLGAPPGEGGGEALAGLAARGQRYVQRVDRQQMYIQRMRRQIEWPAVEVPVFAPGAGSNDEAAEAMAEVLRPWLEGGEAPAAETLATVS